MIVAQIIVVVSCLILLFGAVVFLVANQFKDEPPSYWKYYKKDNTKYWFKK